MKIAEVFSADRRPWSKLVNGKQCWFHIAYDSVCINIQNNLPKWPQIVSEFLVQSELSNLPVTCTQMIATTDFVSRPCYSPGVTKWIKSCLLRCFGTFKMPILMFISILVFRPEGQIWNPVRRDTRIYVRKILNASRISKTQLNSCTISPS